MLDLERATNNCGVYKGLECARVVVCYGSERATINCIAFEHTTNNSRVVLMCSACYILALVAGLGEGLSAWPNLLRWYDFISSKDAVKEVCIKMEDAEVCVAGGRELLSPHGM